jgi:Zn-dependent alcohol dehydrogenase
MTAAVLVEQNTPLRIEEVEIPSLGVGQILVKMLHSGICGKQIDEITGKRGPDPYIPHMLGHEGTGIVTAIGPGITKVQEQDHVVLHWMKGSGIESAPPRFHIGNQIISAGWVTTFSQYTIVSENRVTKIDSNAPSQTSALLGCAVTTGLGIIFNDINLKPGQSVAVFGVGGIGINVLQGAKLINAYPIVAIDVHEHKLDMAREFGATHTFNHNDIKSDFYHVDLGLADGFDAVVDTTGVTQVFEYGYSITSKIGKTIMAGVQNHKEKTSIDAFALHFGKQIIGSHGGSTNPDVDIPRYSILNKIGLLDLEGQITHSYPLEHINDAIEIVRAGDAGRCMIDFTSP